MGGLFCFGWCGVVCGVFCFVWLVLGGVWWCGVLFCFGWCVCVVCFVLGGGMGVGLLVVVLLLSGVVGVLFRRWCYVLVAGVGGGWCWGVRGAFGFGWWWWATQRSVLLRREEMPAAEQPQSGRKDGPPQAENERGGAGVPTPPPSGLQLFPLSVITVPAPQLRSRE